MTVMIGKSCYNVIGKYWDINYKNNDSSRFTNTFFQYVLLHIAPKMSLEWEVMTPVFLIERLLHVSIMAQQICISIMQS